MKVISRVGREDIAVVYMGETGDGKYIEFVESTPPPYYRREKKWALIISTLYGCPVGCKFCDAGGYYRGRVSREDMIGQIDWLVEKRYPDRNIPAEKFKIQFARMGEPSFNEDVLGVLDSLHDLYNAPGLMPSLSTIAPVGREKFFERLLESKKKRYPKTFQLQFSIHTTDMKIRDWLIPVRKWDFQRIAEYGRAFFDDGGRKITLNFALSDRAPFDPDVLSKYFEPDIFLIKITPVNPTYRANKNRISSREVSKKWNELVDSVHVKGYDVILSIGELEENKIGSNCGQYVLRYKMEGEKIDGAYSYHTQI